MKIHITNGNMKLPRTTLNFSLTPQRSCPMATAECKLHCYANKAYKQYPNVKTAWDENFEETLKPTFKDKVSTFLNKKRKWEQFRIHVAGDFYNQSYFNNWIKVAELYKDKIFYAYTKTHTLDLSKKPSNLIVILSDDKQILKEHWSKFDGVAIVSDTHVDEYKGWKVCEGDCKTCNYCYVVTKAFKRIVFNKH